MPLSVGRLVEVRTLAGLLFAIVALSTTLVWQAQASATAPVVTDVSSGIFHTCALTADGGVKCWGGNGIGQLGSATTASEACAPCSATPIDVDGLTGDVVTVSAGLYHTCAVTTSGGVKCWGYNEYAQLGNGETSDSSTPVDVAGLGGVSAVSPGYRHTCALTTAGGVKCWGNNAIGQLGNGTLTDSTAPVDVTGLTSGVAAVSAGSFFTCALTTVGAVKCWGANVSGELGNGGTSNQATPVSVLGLSSGVTAMSTGSFHACAVTAVGGVKCWGHNFFGQLGNGTTSQVYQSCYCIPNPVDVSGLTGAAAVSAGAESTCALTTGQGVKCWGSNGYAQVGNGTLGNLVTTPVDVTGLTSGATAVSVGYLHTCALTVSAGVKCWGDNRDAQLGTGSISGPQQCYDHGCSRIPTGVAGLSLPKPTPTSTSTPMSTPQSVGGLAVDPPATSGAQLDLRLLWLLLIPTALGAAALRIARAR